MPWRLFSPRRRCRDAGEPWPGAARCRCPSRVIIWQARLLVVVLILGGNPAGANELPSLEYQVKASYIYNLVQFVTWPQDGEDAQSGHLSICVLGANRFGTALDLLNDRKASGRTISVRYISDSNGAVGCQVVFVSSSQTRHELEIVASVAGPGVLTIGETPDFIEHGGIINFIKIDDKIRFEINDKVARQAGLHISAQLLNLAIRK